MYHFQWEDRLYKYLVAQELFLFLIDKNINNGKAIGLHDKTSLSKGLEWSEGGSGVRFEGKVRG